jgi:tetratricopeptide (TPR) repeat protein
MSSAVSRLERRPVSEWLLLGVLLLVALPCRVSAQTPEEHLTLAMEKYDAAALPDAIGLFDRAILQLEPNRADSRTRELLVKAYQYRARARIGVGDTAAARLDLLTLLQLQPEFKLPEEVSESLRTVFTEVRRTMIGDLLIVIVPDNAQVEIDGQTVKDLTQPVAFAAGRHVLSARRPGYTSVVDRAFTVEPGTSMELTLSLARNSATVTVVTDPVGVEVIVDGVSRGVTASSESGTTLSAAKLISDLDVRAHRFEFVRPCFSRASQTLDIDKFDDRTLPPVKLEPAIATVIVETATPGVVVFIDNLPRGSAPLTLRDVCEGRHTVELRSPHGRYLRRVDLKPGDRETITGELHPAFALVSSSGGVEGLRGAGDLRADVEARLREVRGFTLYAPALDAAQDALRRRDLTSDWLAFDQQGMAVGGAQKLTPGLRVQLSSDLARMFEAQGVASVTVAPGSSPGQSEVVLALLAAGSSEPDLLPVRLDDGDSLRRTIQRLDVSFPPFRPSLGVLAVDVTGPGSTVVIAADVNAAVREAGLLPADRIVAVNGKKINDVAALTAVLESLGPKAAVSLDVLRHTTTQAVEIPLLQQARAISLGDQSLLFNPLLMHFRHGLAFGANTPAEPVMRLNIGIALMRLGNWEDARLELERTTLPDGPGVGRGTVEYHLGTCYEKLGRLNDAAQAWRKAKDSAAWLTEDGPPVKELAEARLAGTSSVK